MVVRAGVCVSVCAFVSISRVYVRFACVYVVWLWWWVFVHVLLELYCNCMYGFFFLSFFFVSTFTDADVFQSVLFFVSSRYVLFHFGLNKRKNVRITAIDERIQYPWKQLKWFILTCHISILFVSYTYSIRFRPLLNELQNERTNKKKTHTNCIWNKWR